LAKAQRAAGNEQLADLELRAARAILARVGGEAPAEPERPSLAAPAETSLGAMFRCEGDTWCLGFAGSSVRLRDLKGLRYLACLLAEPAREFQALELVALDREPADQASPPPGSESGPWVGGDAGPLLDARAKEAYRRRLTEIDEDIDEATAMADLGRMAQAQAEREFLVRELSRAVGLGGRDRRAGSASERARVSVTRALRQALARIREHHAPLADHLDRAVRTGSHCAYLPEPGATVDWTF
jgi:hypothetical protein